MLREDILIFFLFLKKILFAMLHRNRLLVSDECRRGLKSGTKAHDNLSDYINIFWNGFLPSFLDTTPFNKPGVPRFGLQSAPHIIESWSQLTVPHEIWILLSELIKWDHRCNSGERENATRETISSNLWTDHKYMTYSNAYRLDVIFHPYESNMHDDSTEKMMRDQSSATDFLRGKTREGKKNARKKINIVRATHAPCVLRHRFLSYGKTYFAVCKDYWTLPLDFAHLETGQYKNSPNAWKLPSKTAP